MLISCKSPVIYARRMAAQLQRIMPKHQFESHDRSIWEKTSGLEFIVAGYFTHEIWICSSLCIRRKRQIGEDENLIRLVGKIDMPECEVPEKAAVKMALEIREVCKNRCLNPAK